MSFAPPRPTRRLLLALLACLPIATLTVLYEPLWILWLICLGALLVLAGLDLLLSPSASELELSLVAPGLVHLGEPTSAELGVSRRGGGKRPAEFELLLELEGPAEAPQSKRARLEASAESAGCEVEIKTLRRGELWCERVHARWSGPLGLLAQVKRVEIGERVAVAPNIEAVRRAAIRMASHSTMMQGAKLLKYIGDGTEFEALREYAPGLNVRDVHWGASARHRKLLCRENRSERNHRVIVALDTGALMREPLQGLPRLDHAINAGLLLSLLSLRMGDRVGLFGFDAEVRSYSAPQPGVHTMRRLLQQSAELRYSPLETNFTLGLTALRTKLRRRAIVVIFTDFIDPTSAELMIEHVGLLSKRHVVLFVALRDVWLDALVASPAEDLEGLGRGVVADSLRRDREVVLQRLKRRGVFCIDAAPEEVGVALINRYLDVHRRELVS